MGVDPYFVFSEFGFLDISVITYLPSGNAATPASFASPRTARFCD